MKGGGEMRVRKFGAEIRPNRRALSVINHTVNKRGYPEYKS